MLTDRQSIFLCTFVVISFVVCGILNILDEIYVAGPIILIFALIIINLFITKKESEKEGHQSSINQEETL